MESVLTLNQLTKRYGSITAVDRLDLKIPRGSIFGLLGPNGSGKTTTLGMALSVIRPSSGTSQWFGEEVSPNTLKRIGAILEGPLFYPYLSGLENLRIVARIKGVQSSRIERVLEQVGLFERKGSAFKTYSLGMKQRLAIAAALLAEPEVLILDEPTNGLDPQGIAEIRKLIRDISNDGTTIILASHLLDEVEKVCDHVAVLQKGSLLFSGRVGEMTQRKPLVELAAADQQQLAQVLSGWEGSSVEAEEDLLLLQMGDDPDAAAINRRLFDAGISLTHLAVRKSRLEDQFLDLTQNSEAKS